MSDEQGEPAAYLAAALKEAELTALDASTANGRGWTFHRDPIDNALITGDLDGPFSNVVSFDEGAPSEAQAEHIAAWDPAAVLRHVAAGRTIVELHAPAEYWGPTLDGWLGCTSCGVPAEYPVQWPCATILAEAGRWGWQQS